jgi:hypothetical protein
MAGTRLVKRPRRLKFKKRKLNPPNRETRKTKILRNKKIKEMIIIMKTMTMILIITTTAMIITRVMIITTIIITTMGITRSKINRINRISPNIMIIEIKAFSLIMMR